MFVISTSTNYKGPDSGVTLISHSAYPPGSAHPILPLLTPKVLPLLPDHSPFLFFAKKETKVIV